MENMNFRKNRRNIDVFTGCDWSPGDGLGETETMLIGNFSDIACVEACKSKRVNNTRINGATVGVSDASCKCEVHMSRMKKSNGYKTCYLGKLKIDQVNRRKRKFPGNSFILIISHGRINQLRWCAMHSQYLH